MKYDPEIAKINLAAQLVVYHGHTIEEIAEIAGVADRMDEVAVEITSLEKKASNAPTKYHPKFDTEEMAVRKLQGLAT